MRMKGHAIHDAAEYVPKPLFDYWRKRDPIARFENYLLNIKKWLSPAENRELIADVDRQLEADREFAVASPNAGTRIRGWRCLLRKWVSRDQAEVRDSENKAAKSSAFKPTEAAVHLK